MPSKTPHGQELTREQERANEALHDRRPWIEHVNSSVKRCRIVKDRSSLWKVGIRDLVMEICCVLHNFRVRLPRSSPWFNQDKLKSFSVTASPQAHICDFQIFSLNHNNVHLSHSHQYRNLCLGRYRQLRQSSVLR